jgi:hypothetical protein
MGTEGFLFRFVILIESAVSSLLNKFATPFRPFYRQERQVKQRYGWNDWSSQEFWGILQVLCGVQLVDAVGAPLEFNLFLLSEVNMSYRSGSTMLLKRHQGIKKKYIFRGQENENPIIFFHTVSYRFSVVFVSQYVWSKLWVKRQIDESRAWIDNENR